ncbi:MAG TPA: transposase, partial [Nitrospiraceae bacterium]|nr:transposase [Nitrospiraceae bacterium]
EELHNNHHAFPGSAKFSILRWEFDIGWMYIRLLQMVGLVRVIRMAPKPVHGLPREQIDLETARAVIVNRMHVLRAYARQVTVPLLRKQSHEPGCELIGQDEKLLVREPLLLEGHARSRLQAMLAAHRTLRTAYDFRERLCALWSTNLSNEAALHHLKSWVTQAEESGVEVLREFAGSLRGYAMESQEQT